MKAVLQRVSRGAVHVDGRVHSEIARGLVILLGVEREDTDATATALAKKIAGLRLFDDASGRTNLSNEDVGGEFLVVSQFTLCADLSRGKRPGFDPAMKPPRSQEIYEFFCRELATLTGRPVKRGVFGATMNVEIHNDGPATFVLEMSTGSRA